MTDTTQVGISRLKDFTLFENRIGTVIESYASNPPAGCLYIGVEGTEVNKTDWSELYETIGGEDGSTSAKFVLPYKADDGAIKHYLVGKVLLSDVSASGNISIATFNNADLDNNGYYTFSHGIGHTHPILQMYDQNNDEVLISNVTNSVGQSKIFVLGNYRGRILGTWTVLAIG